MSTVLLEDMERSRASSVSSCFTTISSIAQGRKLDQEGGNVLVVGRMEVGRMERFKGIGLRGLLWYLVK